MFMSMMMSIYYLMSLCLDDDDSFPSNCRIDDDEIFPSNFLIFCNFYQ
jgi:hypothetical protein